MHLDRTSRFSRSIGAACLIIVGACKGTTAEVSQPAISSISAAATTVSLPKGSGKSILFIIERSLDFKGTVTLSTENVPTGMTATFGPSTLTNPATQSLLNITVLPSMAAGTYNITAKASGQQVESKSITMQITVTTPGMTLALGNPSASTLAQGGSITVPVNIVRTGGYTGSVGLTAVGLPAGVTGSFAPAVLPDGTTSSTLTLNAGQFATPTTGTITVRASSSDVEQQTATFDVQVVPSATPSIAVSANPALISLFTTGGTAQSTVTLQRGGAYAGAVTFALDNLPAGVTASFAPSPTTGSTSTLTLTAAPGVTAGSTQATLRASGVGVSDATTPFVVQLTVPPSIALVLTLNPTTIARGGSTTANYGLTRAGGANELVNLVLEGLPAGVTSNVAASIPAGTASVIGSFTITSTAAAAPGAYLITLRGTTAGGLTSSVERTLTITP